MCLFYTFNSIDAQFAVLGLPDTLNYLSAATWSMVGVSVFVCVIIGFLVVYANSFLMKRRKREFGIYGVLGMTCRDINRILVKETISIGGASLIFGILLGIGASQALSMITAKIAGAGIGSYRFIFSGKAMGAAVLFFGITFACVYFFNKRQVKKMKLIDLLYADRKNEKVPEIKKWDVVCGILSLVLMAAGYLVIFRLSEGHLGSAVFAWGFFLSLGTFAFFLSAAGLLFKFLKKRKGFYYHKLNVFNVNQLGSRFKSAGASIAVVCILMSFSMSVMGSCLGLGQSMISQQAQMAPYDVSIIYYTDQNEEGMDSLSVKEALESKNARVSQYLGSSADITLYEVEGQKFAELFMKNYGDRLRKLEGVSDADVSMIGIEDCNEVRILNGQPPLELGSGEYAINYNQPDAQQYLKEYAAGGQMPLTIYGNELQLKENGLYQTTLYNKNALLDLGTLIVPQEVAQAGIPVMKICDSMYSGNPDEAYDTANVDMLKVNEFLYETRVDLFVETLSNRLATAYTGVYLGITFLVTAGAVLALQQLIQSADNEKRYRLLHKLGAEEEAVKKSLRTQMLFCFGLPLLLSAVHSGVVMTGIYRSIPYLTSVDILQNVSFGCVLALVVYSIYFAITYTGCKRTLKL